MFSTHTASCSGSGVLRQFQGLRVSAPCTAANNQTLPRRSVARFAVVARQPESGVGIFGTKAGMTQIFTPEGLAYPATVIALEPGNRVTQVKTVASDGYNAVQVGYKICKEKMVSQPEMGHLRKSGSEPMKHLREFKVCSKPCSAFVLYHYGLFAVFPGVG